jgi:phage terminase large subunit
VEESSSLSQNSIDVLCPTIREPGSEIIFTYNRDEELDPVHKTFVTDPPRNDVWYLHTTYKDNKYFPEVLRNEMEYCKRVDYEKYRHVWLGEPKKVSEAQIFKGKWCVDTFETPCLDNIYQGRFFYGADWGFSTDPTVLVRCFIKDRKLFIEYEAYAVGVELDDIPQLFNSVPESRKWKIVADCSRPETISHIAHKGFNIVPSPKWEGSVEDGIEYLRSFEKIVIHSRCKHAQDEAKYYSYKMDKKTGEVLPIVSDANNHIFDGLRYSLSDYIRKKVSILDVL